MGYDDEIETGDAAAILEAAAKFAEVEVLELKRSEDGSAEVLAVPKGKTLHSAKQFLDEYRSAPDRKRGTATLTTLKSFCDHVKRFADKDSALFANTDPRTPSLTAVLDYHEGKNGSARFGQHRAVYSFPISDEWRAWTSTRPMPQADFAQFIEDHLHDVIDPSSAGKEAWGFVEQLEIALSTPSQLLALSKGLTVYVEAKAKHTVNLSTGEGSLQFETEHRDATGAPLKVPRGFAVGVPVFTGEARYSLPIRLRYKVREGRVTWELLPHRVDQAFRHAVTEACDKASAETGLPLFYGTAET